MWKVAGCLLACAALLAGCASKKSDTAGSVRLLSPADYQAAISSGHAFLVNVHIPYDGEIKDTNAFIPYNDVQSHAAQLPADKSTPLYIYCRSGRMSAAATPELQRLGYTNIVDLKGGMQAWEQAGLPLLRRSGTPSS